MLSGLQSWDWSGVVAAGPEAFSKRIMASHDSAPGVDGIPYSAYKACVDVISELLYKLSRQVATYGAPIPGFNFELLAFIAKKPSSLGSTRV
eukprot:12428706-Karenia_brevis.AAC.1